MIYIYIYTHIYCRYRYIYILLNKYLNRKKATVIYKNND